jgi:multiple sugar transport system substrate-binding protein
MKRNLARLSLLLAISALLLAACGPAATPAAQPTPVPQVDATQPPAVAAGECPPSANGQRFEMWSPLTGPDGDEMTALAERFSRENPNQITVTHVAQPEYVQRLNAAAAANQLPAMTVVRVINVGELYERNVVKPFSAEALNVLGPNFGDEYPDNVWEPGEYEGQRVSIPLDMHTLVMYYNKDLFAQAGLAEPTTEPWTRQEFESALEALQAAGVQPIAIGTAFQGATLFQTFIRQFGGALTNDDGTQATYNSAAGVQALTYVNDLKQRYSPDISGGGDPEVNVFRQGNAAIAMHGPWHISDLQRLPFVGFAPLPQVGSEFAVWAGSHQLALTTDDPAQQAAAACWIKWLSENSLEWAKAGQIPARDSVRLSAELSQVAAPISAVAPSADHAILLPQVPELEGALWGQFGPAVDAVLLGETTDIQGTLDQAVAQSQQIIDENRERYE